MYGTKASGADGNKTKRNSDLKIKIWQTTSKSCTTPVAGYFLQPFASFPRIKCVVLFHKYVCEEDDIVLSFEAVLPVTVRFLARVLHIFLGLILSDLSDGNRGHAQERSFGCRVVFRIRDKMSGIPLTLKIDVVQRDYVFSHVVAVSKTVLFYNQITITLHWHDKQNVSLWFTQTTESIKFTIKFVSEKQ